MSRRVLFWLLWPGLFAYFRFSRRARVVLIDDDCILLVKDRFQLWFNQGQWALPGGGLHRHEAPEAGAVRELKEELGLQLDASQLKPLWNGQVGDYRLRYHGYFLLANISQTVQLRLKSSEIAAAQWHKIGTLDAQPLKPEVQKALQLLAGQR